VVIPEIENVSFSRWASLFGFVLGDRSVNQSTMSMNIFRLAGDMSHVFSIIVLLLRLRVAKNAQGL
jgi:hypothetical protein